MGNPHTATVSHGRRLIDTQNKVAPWHSAYGNQTMQHLMSHRVLQAKLTINPPGDVHEREADRMANAVMRMPDPRTPEHMSLKSQTATVQRAGMCGSSGGTSSECQACEANAMSLRRSPPGASALAIAPTIVQEVLNSPGQPLDVATRSFMEPRFKQDFSGVRVHADPRAAESAQAVNALAYAVGRNLVFAEGKFRPAENAGRRLIAHELSHVVQQEHGGQAAIQRTCDPQALDRKKFLQVTGADPKDAPLGLTPLVFDDVSYPKVELVEHPAKAKAAKPQWTVAPTSAALPDPIASYYTTAGRFTETTAKALVVPDGPCAGKYDQATYFVSAPMAKLLRAGELEHCADYQYAFDLSLAEFAAAVNHIAGKTVCHDSKDKCEHSFHKQLEKKTGIDPDNWRHAFECLALQSETVRDKRKAWHTPTSDARVLTKGGCTVKINLTGLPELGHRPEEIIRCPQMGIGGGAGKTAPKTKHHPGKSSD